MTTDKLRQYIATEGLDRRSASRTNGRMLGLLAAYFGIYAVAEYVAIPFMWPIAWLAMGFVLFGVPAMMHEATHGNLYVSKRANRAAAVLGGSLILLCWSIVRSSHLQHHAATRTPLDPETWPSLRGFPQHLALLLAGPKFIVDMWTHTFSTLRGRPPFFARTASLRRAVRGDVAVMALVYLLLVPLVVAHPIPAIKIWLAPLTVLLVCVLPFLTLPEHLGGRGGDPIHKNARSFITNRALRWVSWNGNYHAAHHLAPNVPFFRLPRLHELVAPDLAWIEKSYLRFHWQVIYSLRHARIDERRPARSDRL